MPVDSAVFLGKILMFLFIPPQIINSHRIHTCKSPVPPNGLVNLVGNRPIARSTSNLAAYSKLLLCFCE